MSDRTSAEIFGTMFEMLAENPTDEHRAIARRVWDLKKRGYYDFSDYQMCCDEALVRLGLARQREHSLLVEYGPES